MLDLREEGNNVRIRLGQLEKKFFRLVGVGLGGLCQHKAVHYWRQRVQPQPAHVKPQVPYSTGRRTWKECVSTHMYAKEYLVYVTKMSNIHICISHTYIPITQYVLLKLTYLEHICVGVYNTLVLHVHMYYLHLPVCISMHILLCLRTHASPEHVELVEKGEGVPDAPRLRALTPAHGSARVILGRIVHAEAA